MKVVIITHHSAAAKYFVQTIGNKHQLLGVFIEKALVSGFKKAFRQFKRNKRKKGLGEAVGRFLELPFILWLEASYRKRQAKFFSTRLADGHFDSFVQLIESVNDPIFMDRMQELKPDVICVFGAGILRTPIIKTPRLCVLNMHTGILPNYRGAKSEFWALANGDFQNVGVTVHVIDEKVDTGPIVAQASVPVSFRDDDRNLRCKTVLAGAELMVQALTDLEAGTFSSREQSRENAALYSTPTISAFFQMKRNLRKLKATAEKALR